VFQNTMSSFISVIQKNYCPGSSLFYY